MGEDTGVGMLEAELGAPVPGAMRELDPDRLQDLAAALHDARTRHRAALDAAIENGLHYVPGVLRGTVRRVVGL